MIGFSWLLRLMGAMAVIVLSDGLANHSFSAPFVGLPPDPSMTTKLSLDDYNSPRLDILSDTAVSSRNEGFSPASHDTEEASQRYGIWGGVLP